MSSINPTEALILDLRENGGGDPKTTIFTACISHRHFDILPNERKIQETDGKAKASTDFDNIAPCSWLFHEGKLYPYEFKRLGKGEAAKSAPPDAFVNDLGAILGKLGVSDVIGIQAHEDGIVGAETTDHDTNISTTTAYLEESEELNKMPNMQVASFAFF